MIIETKRNCENNRLEKFNRFYFPNRMKNIGLAVALLALILLIVNKLIWNDEILRHSMKSIFTLGLLVRGLSKEKIDDELMKSLRFYSFKYALVFAVVLTIVTPYINACVDLLFGITKLELADDKGFFTIFQLVILQQTYFYMLKGFYNEK